MWKPACVCLGLLAAVACGGASGSPTAPSPAATSTPVFSGVRYDNIQTAHEFIIGSPIPTTNQTSTYCCWPLPVRNPGVFIFDLSAFPAGVLPSGGSSNVVSASEMILVGLSSSPVAGAKTFRWYKASTNSVIYSFVGSADFTWAYSYIGRFGWEINEAGAYFIVIDTPWGDARLDFAVTNAQAAADTRLEPVLTTGAPVTVTAPHAHGGGGGGGRMPTTQRLVFALRAERPSTRPAYCCDTEAGRTPAPSRQPAPR